MKKEVDQVRLTRQANCAQYLRVPVGAHLPFPSITLRYITYLRHARADKAGIIIKLGQPWCTRR